MNKEFFTEEYFNSLNYTGYLDRRQKYQNTAKEVVDLLEKLKLIQKSSSILDYGCATGFLMEGLLSEGYDNVYGYDISEWAKEQARSKSLNILDDLNNADFDLAICLDVLEHMSLDEIDEFFNRVDSPCVVGRIPVSTDGGKTFHLEISKRDKTHISCHTKEQWKRIFKNNGYSSFLHINLFTIYDSEGVMCFIALK